MTEKGRFWLLAMWEVGTLAVTVGLVSLAGSMTAAGHADDVPDIVWGLIGAGLTNMSNTVRDAMQDGNKQTPTQPTPTQPTPTEGISAPKNV